MRGVNIHADFVMIQCTKNKNLTPLSHPLCHPAIRRGKLAPFFRHLGSQFKPPHLCTSGVYNFYIILYPLMSIHFWSDFEV